MGGGYIVIMIITSPNFESQPEKPEVPISQTKAGSCSCMLVDTMHYFPTVKADASYLRS